MPSSDASPASTRMRRRADPQRRGLGALLAPPPYPLASIAALAVVCGVEVVAVPGPRTIAHVAALTGLVVAVGALQGVLWQLALGILGSIRRVLAWAVVAVFALAAGYWLADTMGALARLGSRYDALARTVLIVSAGGAVSFGALVALVRPSPDSPRGPLGRLDGRLTAVTVAVLVGAAGALAYVDQTYYIGLYLDAHFALRLCTAWTLMFAFVLGTRRIAWRPWRRRAWLAVALATLVPLAVLRDDRIDSLQALVTRPWSATVLRIARRILDLDRDGHSALLGGGDCNDFDPHIHPAAREIRGNGIDDNCAFGDAAEIVINPADVPVPETPSPLNVVLITIDCLRWDRLGLNHTTGLRATPKLSAWGKRAVNFRRAYSSGAWTSIAVGALMRGTYARRLEWTAYYETSFYRLLRDPTHARLGARERVAKMFPVAWHDPRWSLPQWLQRRNMQTIAVVDDGFSQMLAKAIGVDRGFDIFREVSGEPDADPDAFMRARYRYRRARDRHDDSATATAAISSIRWSARGSNFFAWIHFFGPHTPSTDHEGLGKFPSTVMGSYDEEVRYLDEHLDRLLQAVDELEMPTAVIVTADHGERFYKDYRSHGADLDEEVLRVPLLVRVPGWAPKNVDVPVSHVDLLPTILALTETPAPPNLDGIDLARTLTVKKARRRTLFADTWHYDRYGKIQNDLVAAFDGRHKIVLDRMNRSMLGYDQREPRARPLRIEGLAVDGLVRAVSGYLEESGGTLSLER